MCEEEERLSGRLSDILGRHWPVPALVPELIQNVGEFQELQQDGQHGEEHVISRHGLPRSVPLF